MSRTITSLMSGGWEPDNDFDMATLFDLWVEEVEAEFAAKSINELLNEQITAIENNDTDNFLYDLLVEEIGRRHWKLFLGTEHCKDDDRRKMKSEPATETEELPF